MSSRLRLLIGVSVVVILALVAVNWVGLTRLAHLQDDSYKRTQDAGQLRQGLQQGARGQATSVRQRLHRPRKEKVIPATPWGRLFELYQLPWLPQIEQTQPNSKTD